LILKGLDICLRGLQRSMSALGLLARALQSGWEQEIEFPGEGGLRLRIPRASWSLRLSEGGAELARRAQFITRPECEPLLRRLVHQLYAAGLIPSDRSVIDIGCWLGDNALVWATFLDPGDASVHAVDPSPSNLAFAQSIATANGLDNIVWHEAICSDDEGQSVVVHAGDLEHATFVAATSTESLSALMTTTLDSLIPAGKHAKFGLIHVDVEGFEHAVLKGASGIISASDPFILFEGHLRSADEISRIERFLSGHSYKTFLINEVLQGCLPDCRNFLAVPESLCDDVLSAVRDSGNDWTAIFPAVPGQQLIPLR
jgi:FkbM family methyltransferase